MKTLLVIVVTGISLSLQAQNKYFKTDGGIGAALTFGDKKSYGISVGVEPKVFFTPKLAAGLRFEGDALFGGSIPTTAGGTVDVSTSTRAAILLKGEYYFSESEKRPFVGVMLGRYTQANVGSSSTGSASIAAGTYFGYAPELGITLKNFRISGIYHFVPGTDLVTMSSGSPVEVSRNYLVIQLGFKMFQSEKF